MAGRVLLFLQNFLSLYKFHLMHPAIWQIAKEYKSVLHNLYGNELAELVLFGSYARGDQHDESDVDFAIVLHDNHIRTADDRIKTSFIDSRLSLKYGLMLSSLVISFHTKQTSMQGVYQDIRKEGIII
jgi:predicted nucleotidyltransferase